MKVLVVNSIKQSGPRRKINDVTLHNMSHYYFWYYEHSVMHYDFLTFSTNIIG